MGRLSPADFHTTSAFIAAKLAFVVWTKLSNEEYFSSAYQ
jgi:hypothetical protein